MSMQQQSSQHTDQREDSDGDGNNDAYNNNNNNNNSENDTNSISIMLMPQQQQQQQQQQQRTQTRKRRLVVLIGPPKTASTSLQKFLAKYASSKTKKPNTKKKKNHSIPAFAEWNYPLFLGHPNGIRDLDKGYRHRNFAKIRDQFLRQDPTLNLVVGSEYFIHYPKTLDGHLFEELSNWTSMATTKTTISTSTSTSTTSNSSSSSSGTTTTTTTTSRVIPEVVLMSRSPRTSHLVSIWKQRSQVKQSPFFRWTFSQFVCSSRENNHNNDNNSSSGPAAAAAAAALKEEAQHILERRIGGFANPLGIAHHLIYNDGYHLPVHVMDMGGISKQGLDVSHAFSCSVLKVNCTTRSTDGTVWIQGLEGVAIHANTRQGEAHVTPQQAEQMEALFQQRDCMYWDELHNHPLFHLWYRQDDGLLWPNDCKDILSSSSSISSAHHHHHQQQQHQQYHNFRNNVSTLLEEFRYILQCPGYGQRGNVTTINTTTTTTSNPDDYHDDHDVALLLPNQRPFEVAAYLILILLLVIMRTFSKRRRGPRRGKILPPAPTTTTIALSSTTDPASDSISIREETGAATATISIT